MILHVLLTMVTGWFQRHQQHVIAYLQEENRVLKAHLGNRQLRLTDTEHRRLAVLAHESAKLWGDFGMLGGDDRMSGTLHRVILPENMMHRLPTEKSWAVWKTSRHELSFT